MRKLSSFVSRQYLILGAIPAPAMLSGFRMVPPDSRLEVWRLRSLRSLPAARKKVEQNQTYCLLTVQTKVRFCSVFFFWVGPGGWSPAPALALCGLPSGRRRRARWVLGRRRSGAAGPSPLALLRPSAPPAPPAPPGPPLGGAGGVRTGGGGAAAPGAPAAAPSACRPWHRSPSRYCSHDSTHGGPSRCLHTSP